mgnify:CR=1 FL=1
MQLHSKQLINIGIKLIYFYCYHFTFDCSLSEACFLCQVHWHTMSYLPPLTDEDVFTFINKKICDILIPHLFSVVIIWGCGKNHTQTFFEFLKSKKNRSWAIEIEGKIEEVGSMRCFKGFF